VSRCTPREQGPCRWPSRVLSCVSVSPRVRWRGTPVRSRQSLPTRVTPILQRRGTVTWAPPPAGPTEGNRSAIAAGLGAATSRLPSRQRARSATSRPWTSARGALSCACGSPLPWTTSSSSTSCSTTTTSFRWRVGASIETKRKTSPASRAAAESGSPLERGR